MSERKFLPQGRLPDQEDIRKAALIDPTVHAGLMLAQEGACTEEEALRVIILALLDQNRSLLEQLWEAVQWSVKPIRLGNLNCPASMDYLRTLVELATREARQPPAPR